MHCPLTLDTLDFLNGCFSLRVLPSPANTWHLFAHGFFRDNTRVTLSLLFLCHWSTTIFWFSSLFHKVFFLYICDIVVGQCHLPHVIPSFIAWWNWIRTSKFVLLIAKPSPVDGLIALKCDSSWSFMSDRHFKLVVCFLLILRGMYISN
jgi:hypothetical protein